MLIVLGSISLLIACQYVVNGHPVLEKIQLEGAIGLPRNEPVSNSGWSLPSRIRPFVIPDPTHTLICRVLLLNLTSIVDGSLPLYFMPEAPIFVLRKKYSQIGYPAEFEIEPWEVLAYIPGASDLEPDITSLLAAPAPVLCVAPDRPRPHPVLFAPGAVQTTGDSSRPQRPLELEGRPGPADSASHPPSQPTTTPQGLFLEPSINPTILESILNSVNTEASTLPASNN